MPRLDYGSVAEAAGTFEDYEDVASPAATFLDWRFITEGIGAAWRAVVAMMRRA